MSVPWLWTPSAESEKDYPASNPQGLTLSKLPPTLARRFPVQLIFLNVIPVDPKLNREQQSAAWLRMFRQTHPEARFERGTPDYVPQDANCETATPRPDDGTIVSTCISIDAGWGANFEGQQAELPTFELVMKGLKSKS